MRKVYRPSDERQSTTTTLPTPRLAERQTSPPPLSTMLIFAVLTLAVLIGTVVLWPKNSTSQLAQPTVQSVAVAATVAPRETPIPPTATPSCTSGATALEGVVASEKAG